jgi:Ran GTPase-activating protein (RanGAP) involved in mRNA processing and transport
LNLGNNQIGAEGAKEIAQSLQVNSALSSLNLQRNSIGDEGAEFFMQALERNFVLQLDLRSNDVGDNTMEAIRATVYANQHVIGPWSHSINNVLADNVE